MSGWITDRRPLREPSHSVSNQTHSTCYAHVIARCMRRLLYTFYDIPSETSIEEYYDEDNMNIEKYFEYSGMEMEDINMLHERPSRAIYNYYEHFSALVYLYFFNLAININIEAFGATNGGLNGGSVYEIFYIISGIWIRDYGHFISTLKAEKYKDEYLLRAVYAFISATGEDPHLQIECFKNNFFDDAYSELRMIKLTRYTLTELGIDIESSDLTVGLIKLCDYALDNGYTCTFFCQNVEADLGHFVLIVGREPSIMDPDTISYKIKNSWGSECVGDVDEMHIRNNYVEIQDLDDTGCQLIVVLPKKTQQPNKNIRDIMNDIVYGRISSIEFDWYDEQERLIEEERLAEEEQKRRVEKERVAEEKRVVQVEEPRSARGRSPKTPSSRSPGRKSRSPGRKSKSPGRKSRSRSRGGSRKTHRKRPAHRKTTKNRN